MGDLDEFVVQGNGISWPALLERAEREGYVVERMYRASDPAIVVAPKGFTVPAGLDARPVLRYTVHCSQCGKPAPSYEWDDVTAIWRAEDLPKIGDYHLEDGGWKTNDGLHDPDFGGRVLVCPECWQVAWCEGCDAPIHVWQPLVEDPSDNTHRHVDCVESEVVG
jgi:hypothetical protein